MPCAVCQNSVVEHNGAAVPGRRHRKLPRPIDGLVSTSIQQYVDLP